MKPSCVEVARSLKNLALLWRPPDSENDSAPAGNRGTDGTGLHDRLKSTRATLDEQGGRP